MATFLDRLLGRTSPQVKAVMGPGAFALDYYPQVVRLSANPNRLMSEAQALFHSNVWVAAAERAIVQRAVTRPWHLEDAQTAEVDDTSNPNLRAVRQLIERPSAMRTRRQLWGLTLRHLGLCGNSFWYLDQTDQYGIPREVLYVNPARMTPVDDPNGNLLGWMLDDPNNPVTGSPGRPGTPLQLDEVIHFTLDEPDWGHWGIGVAETAQAKAELARLTDRHAQHVMASGGRLAGMLAPKDATLVSNDDAWQTVVRDYRNIVADPDSAKRLQVLRFPVDFTQTSADPTQLQLVSLSQMSRQDILAAWSVPESQVGIVVTRGLNSGEAQSYDEATIWQGAAGPRLVAFQEAVQYTLLDRWQALGINVSLVIDQPSFDDQTPAFENAQRALGVPMTNNERRALLGLDPLEEQEYGDLGDRIVILNTMTEITSAAVPGTAPLMTEPQSTSGEASAGSTPAPEGPQGSGPADRSADTQGSTAVSGKADTGRLTGLRASIDRAWTPRLRRAVRAVLDDQKADVAQSVTGRYAQVLKKPRDTQAWWNAQKWDRRLSEVLLPLLEEMAGTVSRRASRIVLSAKADPIASVVSAARDKAAQRITAINQTTRDELAAIIEEGVSEGLSPTELADAIEAATSFDEYRSELIARTEAMLTYNTAALGTYSELGVETVLAVDGDGDEQCAARNGNYFTIDEANTIEDHPNGTLDWIPEQAPADAFVEGE